MPRGATAAPMPLAPSPWSWPKSCGPGWPSELAFTVKPRKSGIAFWIWVALRFHQPRNGAPVGSSCALVSVSGANRLSVGAGVGVGGGAGRNRLVGRRVVLDQQREPDPVGTQRVGERRLLGDVGRR